MLAVRLNKPQFEYDIHSIVKAFYPAETVKVFEEGTKDFESDGDNPSIAIWFEERAIRVNLSGTEHEAVLSRPEERPVVKNELKQLLYRVLSAYTGKELPWGTLTGIRPTKIAMQFLEENAPGTQNPMTEADILSYMQETYYCSEEKALLAIDIAKREKRILADIHYEKGYSLYIGIPFCPTTCLYCSFTSFPIFSWKDRVGEYLTALEKEIDFVREACQDKILDSVYIGGGTPTTLEPEELRRLLSKVRASFDFSQVKEFTVEAGRADSITRDKLRALKEFGVTRISVNPQTMNQETLNIIGRRHTVGQVEEAFRLAREEGFTNINMDLILGLPGETKEHVERTMEAVTRLCPDSLTVHSLAIKRASRLSLWIEENGIETLHNTDETMEIAAEGAARMNMKPYYLYRQKYMSGGFENVGWCRPGGESLYNICMMEELHTILSLGAGGVTKLIDPGAGSLVRLSNPKYPKEYIDHIDAIVAQKEDITWPIS